MKKKRHISITTVILIPFLVLGIVSVISNIQGINNIKKVNSNASEIADGYMQSIVKLSEIQKETLTIHTKGLSHIVATDLDTMISMVDTIRAEQEILEGYLADYEENYLQESDRESFEKIVSNYEGMKYEIENMMAYSANNEKEAAHFLANGTIAEYNAAIQQEIGLLIENANAGATEARVQLADVYASSLVSNTFTIISSVLILVVALLCVAVFVIRPITGASKQIHNIISDIDRNEGDLTKRVSVASIKEVAELGNGFNTFMDKLQNILKLIIENTNEMRVVVDEVQDSVRTSNDSASDLSAVTEELAATMMEVSRNDQYQCGFRAWRGRYHCR